MKEPKIKRVDSNKSKGKTYKALIEKYNDAMQNGYYGEAELIVYAFLEDRLRAFIYYSGLIDNRNANKVNENGVEIIGEEIEIKNITNKIKLIGKSLDLCSKNASELTNFQGSLRRCYKATVKVGEMKKSLDKIDKWCKYRNEIVHGLFNKDLNALRAGFKEHIEEGFELARYIDSQVSKLKTA